MRNFLVIGSGSIAQRHVRNLRLLLPEANISLLHHGQAVINSEIFSTTNQVITSIEEALSYNPDAAIIAGPASLHVDVGLLLAKEGLHLFVEKPLSHELSFEAEKLIQLCQDTQRILMVGYNLRFLPSLKMLRSLIQQEIIGSILSVRVEVGQYLPNWRPGQDYRQSVSAQSQLGGGVILELSHELDYLLWLFGLPSAVIARMGKYSRLEIDVEDCADILFDYNRDDKHFLANVHLDMLQHSSTRTCKVVGTAGTLLWDGITNKVECFLQENPVWSTVFHDEKFNSNEMYIEELQHFITCINSNNESAVNGVHGLQVLQLVEAIKKSAETNHVVNIPAHLGIIRCGYTY